jgi:parallel beta-helix repeat protein
MLAPGSTSSFVLDNQIGTDPSGTIALGNADVGIEIDSTGINFVQTNIVAFNASHGIQVNDGQRNTLRRNSIFSNTGDGIILTGTGNAQLAAPTLVSNPVTGISGTACADCRIELFADSNDEGRQYLDFRLSDGEGGFAFGLVCSPAYPNFTATATDRTGNTSQFSLAGCLLEVQLFISSNTAPLIDENKGGQANLVLPGERRDWPPAAPQFFKSRSLKWEVMAH